LNTTTAGVVRWYGYHYYFLENEGEERKEQSLIIITKDT
jgi:hypothetical protein